MAKKILIVDDEKDLRDALGAALRAEGYEVVEAVDGEAGLATALAEKPDLIMLDLIMPKMDGFRMMEQLRADSWGKDARVVLLSVLEDVETISRVLNQGGYDYIVKTDWKLQDIVEKIRNKLASS
jgi:DNA-binding response OmpR family regulator